MMWRNWNKADKTLLAAGVIFLFALCLHIQYPNSMFADGFLFCAEAALVGGIADWFAVTALFRKPLGFPWHTAILPRRRQEFTEATGRMLQKEFFSKKKLLKKAKSIDYAEKLALWLENEDNNQKTVRWLQGTIIRHIDLVKEIVAERLSNWIDSEAFAGNVFDIIKREAENGRVAAKLLDELVGALDNYIGDERFRTTLLGYLEKYRDEKMNNPFAKMMGGFAEATDIINLEEAADLTKKQAGKLIDQLKKADSEERQALLVAISDIVKMSLNNEDFKKDFSNIWSNINRKNFLIRNAVLSIDTSADNKAGRLIQWFSSLMVENLQTMLHNNHRIRAGFNESVYQIAGRGALQAQEMLGDITRDVMESLTDEQMNHLIYDKAEPDLLWIRMNGSIVGAVVGLGIFVLSIL